MKLNGHFLSPVVALCGVGFAVEAITQGGTAARPAADEVSVRYQIADVQRSIKFYTQQLGFTVEQQTGPFASVTRGKLRLILSGPGTSGARDMPNGQKQAPGGWNRILIYVDDLASQIERLKKADVHFRNKVETGPGGSQILIDDPDGNPIELHEAPKAGQK